MELYFSRQAEWPSVHTNPFTKSKALFKPEEYENAGFELQCRQKTLKTELFVNDDFTMIMWFL